MGGTIPEESDYSSHATGKRAAAAPSDEELVARLVRREESALGELYDRYGRLSYMIALRITGDRAAAAEVLEEVFRVVWQSAGSLQPGDSVAAWLVRLTRYRAINANRSRLQAYREVSDDVGGAGATDEHAEDLMPRETVRRALAALPQAQRRVLELAYYSGLTCAEIAARLGEPVGTVRSHLRLGLMKLRELLRSLEEQHQEDNGEC